MDKIAHSLQSAMMCVLSYANERSSKCSLESFEWFEAYVLVPYSVVNIRRYVHLLGFSLVMEGACSHGLCHTLTLSGLKCSCSQQDLVCDMVSSLNPSLKSCNGHPVVVTITGRSQVLDSVERLH